MRITKNSVIPPKDTAANMSLLKQAPSIVANAIARGWIRTSRPLSEHEIDRIANHSRKQDSRNRLAALGL